MKFFAKNEMHDTGFLNELWAELIVKTLVFHGVRLFCIAPGSRSTPLTLAASQHPLVETVVHFDERGLAYFACGYVKSSLVPACIIVTSGSAVGNLLPAIMEASQENLPLILLTADRPPELRETGANQTLDQVKLFQSYVRWQFDLPCPDLHITEKFVQKTLSQAVHYSITSPSGPVHINCMFREPLFVTTQQRKNREPQTQVKQSPTILHSPKKQLPEEAFEEIAQQLSSIEKGIVITGMTYPPTSADPIFMLAKRLGWPIFSDVLSTARFYGRDSSLIPYYELILKSCLEEDSEAIRGVLHFGDHIVSKSLMEWISKQQLKLYMHISPHPKRYDPYQIVTHKVECDIPYFCEQLSKMITKNEKGQWISFWKDLSNSCEASMHQFFKKKTSLSDKLVMRYLVDEMDRDSSLFIANSMPIRDANALLFPMQKVGCIYGNRGHSGIDGNIATAVGISKGSRERLIAILGDLSFLHDVNSLALLKGHSYPIILIVINNNGGGIFSFLPISEKKEFCEKFLITPHSYELKHAAQMFGIDYFQLKTLDQFLNNLEKTRETKKHAIFEIFTDREENLKEHNQLITYLKRHIQMQKIPCLSVK